MGIITGAKILTGASPTMASPTVTNLTTTTLTSSGLVTGTAGTTGYFIQRVNYPAATTSTVFLNTICTAQTLLFVQGLGFNPNNISTGGSSMPYATIGAATSGSFTLTSALASGSVLALDVLLVKY